MTSNQLFPTHSGQPGFRLHKLEVYNWGTFDGRVYTVEPSGETTLLVGHNGAGKSTLVDAILTLLVPRTIRNYNVAAGAGKRERSPRTYVKGAYNRLGGADGNGTDVQFLRPAPDGYSVLLACFRNADSGEAFTLAQIVFLSAESPEQVHCFADDERSIAGDFAELGRSDGIVTTLQQRGLRATRTFDEYARWFRKRVGGRSKAMEVLNQTVAVKDVQRLNVFIRTHMLEPHNWTEKVEQLLEHFADLSRAHERLQHARRQFDALGPIVRAGERYSQGVRGLDEAERSLEAVSAFFDDATVGLLEPRLREARDELAGKLKSKAELTDRLREVREE